MDVFDLAAKISLDTSPFEKGLDSAKGKMSAFGDVFKANIASDVVSKGFSAIASGTKAVVGGLKNLVDQSQQAYGDYQQMVGGVQKLYGNMGKGWKEYAKMTGDSSAKAKAHYKDLQEAQDLVLKNAEKAYQTSGMSMNQYMETATQFSASLISSLGGDTKKAAEQTDIAMRAISDNFNTFGGNIEDVTNAFKGFSKQNYTMLDNLKLGYGGTKTEMERLIKDANEWGKANGKASNLSINSFSDVVTAIEQIQEKQQIAGTTAREASTTLQGSMLQMQSAWENLKTAMADPDADLGKKVDQLVETITGRTATAEDVAIGAAKNIGDHVNGYLDNLLPVVSQALDGVANLISNAGPIIAEQIPHILETLIPPVLSAAANLADAVITNLPSLVQSIEDALSESFGAIGDPSKLAEKATEIISGFAGAITEVIPNLITVGAEILTALIQGITDNSQTLLSGAAQIIAALGNGIIQNLPQITGAAVQFIQAFTQYIVDNKEQIEGGIVALIGAISDSITELAPEVASAALAIVTALGGGLIQSIPEIVKQLPDFVSGIFGAIGDAFAKGSGSERAALALTLAPIISGGIGDAIGKVKDAKDLVGKGTDIIGKIFGKGEKSSGKDSELFDMLDDLDPKISKLDSLKEGLSGVKDALSGIGGKALDGFKSLGTILGNLGTTIGSGVLQGLQSIGSIITGTVIPAIGTAMTTIGPFLPLIAGISAAIVGVILVIKNWDKVSAALQVTWQALNTAANAVFNAIKTVITGAWETIKTVTTTVWTAIKNLVTSYWTAVSKVASTVFNGIKNVITKAWNAIKSTTTAVWNAIKTVVTGCWKGLSKVASTVFNGIKKVITAVWNAIKSVTSSVWNGIKSTLSNIWTGISNTAKKMFNTVKKIVTDMVNTVKDRVTDFVSAGGDLVKGIWNGIKDKTAWILGKIKGFGKSVVKGMKKTFDINSPSRVMRDEVGMMIGEGVAVGIDKSTAKAEKSARNLAKKVIKAAKDDAVKTNKSSDSLADKVIDSVSTKKKVTKKVTETKTIKSGKDKGKTKTTTKNKSVEVDKTQDELDADVIKAGKAKVKSLQDANKMTEKEEERFWLSIASKRKKGGLGYSTAMQLSSKAAEKQQKTTFKKLQENLENYEAKHGQSAQYETNYWKTVLDNSSKGSYKYTQAQKQLNKAIKKLGNERFEQMKDGLEKAKAEREGDEEMTLADELAYWQNMIDSAKKYPDAYKKVQKEISKIDKQIQKEEQSAWDSYKKSMKSAVETYEKALETAYKKVESRRDELLSGLNIGSVFDKGDAVSKSAAQDAQKTQIEGLREYSTMIDQLREKVGETSYLFEEIDKMAPEEAYQWLHMLLNDMSDEELKEYAEGEEQKKTLALTEANIDKTTEVEKDAQQALDELLKTHKEAWTTYSDDMAKIGVKLTDFGSETEGIFTSAEETYASVLKEMNVDATSELGKMKDTINKSLDSIIPRVDAKKGKQDAELYLNALADILSGDGGVAKTVTESTTKVKDAVNKAVSDIIPTADNKDVAAKVETMNTDVDTAVTNASNIITNGATAGNTKLNGLLDKTVDNVKTHGQSIVENLRDAGSKAGTAFIEALSASINAQEDTLKSLEQRADSIARNKTDLLNKYGVNTDYGSYKVGKKGDQTSVLEAVQGIQTTLDTWLPELSNTNVTLDSGQLIGSIAGGMNEQLAYINGRKAGAFA